MWQTNTIWFEIAVVNIYFLLGNIFMGHFEERGSPWKKLFKYLLTLLLILAVSLFFGRTVAMITLAVFLVPVVYVHAVLLPKKGINGWTGEPKSKYYDFRGWDKNIFSDTSQSTQNNDV